MMILFLYIFKCPYVLEVYIEMILMMTWYYRWNVINVWEAKGENVGLHKVGSKLLIAEIWRWYSCFKKGLLAQLVKNLPAVQEIWVQSLGLDDSLEKEMATHSGILAWKIPWTEKSSGLQSMELQSQTWLKWLNTTHTREREDTWFSWRVLASFYSESRFFCLPWKVFQRTGKKLKPQFRVNRSEGTWAVKSESWGVRDQTEVLLSIWVLAFGLTWL